MDLAVEDRFFTTLGAVLAARLGAEHPCSVAAVNAGRTPSQANVDTAQAELARLEPETRREVDAELERWMRENV